MPRMLRLPLVLCSLMLAPALAFATPPATVGARACAAIAGRVDASPGPGAVFLGSYDAAGDPALSGAAFTYDNALAVIALVACDRAAQASRIAEALLAAATGDRAGAAGRLRNAYRAGPLADGPPPPFGWWSAAEGRWLEDAYQVGTATGNIAWAALALLTMAEQSGDRRFAEGAARLAGWAVTHTASPAGRGGFMGGIHGWEETGRPLTWTSTEHNVDLAAVFAWLRRSGTAGAWAAAEREARRFLEAMWDADTGRFVTGTSPDGTPNMALSGLDAQLWPLLLPDAPPGWRRALDYAERAHGVAGGFDFNDDRDGLWVEGTAQAALAYRAVGRDAEAERLLAGLAGEVSPGGYLWATRGVRITTGLAIGPDSRTADFFYYRRPHLGATAWAVLAATGWNPFTGRPVR